MNVWLLCIWSYVKLNQTQENEWQIRQDPTLLIYFQTTVILKFPHTWFYQSYFTHYGTGSWHYKLLTDRTISWELGRYCLTHYWTSWKQKDKLKSQAEDYMQTCIPSFSVINYLSTFQQF